MCAFLQTPQPSANSSPVGGCFTWSGHSSPSSCFAFGPATHHAHGSVKIKYPHVALKILSVTSETEDTPSVFRPYWVEGGDGDAGAILTCHFPAFNQGSRHQDFVSLAGGGKGLCVCARAPSQSKQFSSLPTCTTDLRRTRTHTCGLRQGSHTR